MVHIVRLGDVVIEFRLQYIICVIKAPLRGLLVDTSLFLRELWYGDVRISEKDFL